MIKTQRLILTPFTDRDARAFYDLSRDSGFTLFPINDYRQDSEASALTWIREKSRGKFAVRRNDSPDLIGMGGLTPWIWEGESLIDITYRLRESAWGQGLGWELAEGLRNFGLDQKFTNMTLTITPDNFPSKKIAHRLGFVLEKKILLLGVETELYRYSSSSSSSF